jgi:hypothetical protein
MLYHVHKEGVKALNTNNINRKMDKMNAYQVQAIYGENFEDIYVEAKNEKEAINKAKKITSLKSKWTKFVI